jgi:hypothetical protein
MIEMEGLPDEDLRRVAVFASPGCPRFGWHRHLGRNSGSHP